MVEEIRRRARLRKVLVTVGMVLVVAAIVVWLFLDQRSNDQWFDELKDEITEENDFIDTVTLEINGTSLYINIYCEGELTPELTDPVARLFQSKLSAEEGGKPIYAGSFESRGQSVGANMFNINFYENHDSALPLKKIHELTVSYQRIYDTESFVIKENGALSAELVWYRNYDGESIEFNPNED